MTRLCHLLSLRERIHQYKEHMVNLYVGGNCKYLAADMSFFPNVNMHFTVLAIYRKTFR